MKIHSNTKLAKVVTGIAISTVLAACASKPTELATTYVSPLKYKDYNCDQIVTEMDHVSHRTVELYNILDKKASDDSAQMGVGLVLFFPALFFLEGGDGPEAVEYSSLKGEYEALRTSSVQKECATAHIKSPADLIQEEQEKKKQTQASAG